MSEEMKRRHKYHAEAHAYSGDFRLPLSRHIPPQAYVDLHSNGGYRSQTTGEFHVENVMSYRSAQTQVGGNKDTKPGHGWSTIVTSVIEGLNIMNVVTADRIVSQIGTEFPLEGYVPSVTFIGTRYENFRIWDEPVEIEMDFDLLGPKPAKDLHYNVESGFISRVCQHYERVLKAPGIPDKIAARYNRLPTVEENRESIECSLVKRVGGVFRGCAYGNVIDVPDFGTIELATVSVAQSDPHSECGTPQETLIELAMLKLDMGCVVDGSGSGGTTKTNGRTYP